MGKLCFSDYADIFKLDIFFDLFRLFTYFQVMIYKEALTPAYINEIYNFRTVDWYKNIYYG